MITGKTLDDARRHHRRRHRRRSRRPAAGADVLRGDGLRGAAERDRVLSRQAPSCAEADATPSCKCFGVGQMMIERTIRFNRLTSLEQVTYYTKAGGELQLLLQADRKPAGAGQCRDGRGRPDRRRARPIGSARSPQRAVDLKPHGDAAPATQHLQPPRPRRRICAPAPKARAAAPGARPATARSASMRRRRPTLIARSDRGAAAASAARRRRLRTRQGRGQHRLRPAVGQLRRLPIVVGDAVGRPGPARREARPAVACGAGAMSSSRHAAGRASSISTPTPRRASIRAWSMRCCRTSPSYFGNPSSKHALGAHAAHGGEARARAAAGADRRRASRTS